MTTYGTIPTGPSGVEFISTAKERIKSGLGTRRPWREMIHRYAFAVPPNVSEALVRGRTNVAYFRMNYTIIVLLILFLSLLWHPISLIVFIAMMAAWLFLYFLRDQPLVIAGRTMDDRVVLIVLAVVTIVALLLTQATLNIIVSLLIGLAVVLVHASFRKTEDLFLDEESMGSDGNGLTRPLSASSS
ncbi:PRA1 family protein F3-like [Macadamia integrifolia]|uniref:PRA1 family protein F3-like n=1 Tax=Macadamia integrifolia TaxID=60698 RepID=UPI001C4EC647|nr:PRA1 family protein F3-like [Macadamia integrifolia]